MSAELVKYRITADEYERMGETGVFSQDARLELIEGEIYAMSPIGSPHAACVDALTFICGSQAAQRFIVRVQNPVRVSDLSEPQPDVALLRWRGDFYRGAHPRPEDVLLVVEVADATVLSDRAVKLPLYSRGGIQEVWIVNVPESQIEVYADPAGGAYQTKKVFARGEAAQSLTLDGLTVNVSEVLG